MRIISRADYIVKHPLSCGYIHSPFWLTSEGDVVTMANLAWDEVIEGILKDGDSAEIRDYEQINPEDYEGLRMTHDTFRVIQGLDNASPKISRCHAVNPYKAVEDWIRDNHDSILSTESLDNLARLCKLIRNP